MWWTRRHGRGQRPGRAGGRAAGQCRRRLHPAARGPDLGGCDRGGGHPPVGPAHPGPRDHGVRADRVVLRGQRGTPYAGSGRCPAGGRWSRWSPTAACPASPTPVTGWSARPWTPASRSPPPPGPARSPPRWRCPGCPATGSSSRVSCRGPARPALPPARTRRRAAHPGALRGAAPDRGRARRPGRPFGADRPAAVCRELTKTYEEIRRAPRRIGRLGQRRRPARRDHRGGGRRAGRSPRNAHRTRCCARRSPPGRRPATPAATRSPPSPSSSACVNATSTPWCAAATSRSVARRQETDQQKDRAGQADQHGALGGRGRFPSGGRRSGRRCRSPQSSTSRKPSAQRRWISGPAAPT